nr:hypothetical protein 7 [Piscirickettsiaceae bacterium]
MAEFIPACVGDGAYIETVTGTDNYLNCVNGSWGSVELGRVMGEFSFAQLPPEMLAAYFAAGFGVYVLFWAVSEPVRQLFKVFR